MMEVECVNVCVRACVQGGGFGAELTAGRMVC